MSLSPSLSPFPRRAPKPRVQPLLAGMLEHRDPGSVPPPHLGITAGRAPGYRGGSGSAGQGLGRTKGSGEAGRGAAGPGVPVPAGPRRGGRAMKGALCAVRSALPPGAAGERRGGRGASGTRRGESPGGAGVPGRYLLVVGVLRAEGAGYGL